MQLRKIFQLTVFLSLIAFTFFIESCKSLSPTAINVVPAANYTYTYDNIIPSPFSARRIDSLFVLSQGMAIYVQPNSDEIFSIGQFLADKLNPSTGYAVKVSALSSGQASHGSIYLILKNDPALGDEGYELYISKDSVRLQANRPSGLFRGVQTIRQILPPSIESLTPKPGPWAMPQGVIKDYPRFQWRGAMLDVARHFFTVQDVKRYIDLLAYYKMNTFHMHLSDDQGWRIMINAWPRLASFGGSTQVGGGKGGYYSQADYTEIVYYAKSRYITVVPEIDMPGHTNAALASYAELNENGIAPQLYSEIGVGFSSFAIDKDITYKFVSDVVMELAALTPGPYIHIGGDEAHSTKMNDYINFVERVEPIVRAAGKQMIGWEEISYAFLSPGTVSQYWAQDSLAQKSVQKGAKLVMSPSSRMYMDMKYSSSTSLGLDWAGYIEVEDAYNWDPASKVIGVKESNILGIEAPLWSETITTISDIEYLAFPRICCYAEIGWASADKKNWDQYKVRLGLHGSRLTQMGVNFYQSSQVPWR